MTKKSKARKFTPGKGYEKLVADIKKISDQAYVQGVDFNREHFLNCYACECFEGMTEKGSRAIYKKDGSLTDLDVDFTVLTVKRRDYVLKNGGLRWRTTYCYLCGVCGAEQTVLHVDEFSKPDNHQQPNVCRNK